MSRGASKRSEKPRSGLVELHRRDADVEHDPVRLFEAESLRDRVEVAEARLDEAQPSARGRDEVRACADGRRIAVERDDVRAALEQRPRIAARAERSVDDQSLVARLKRLEDLGEENRNVARSLAHAGGPGVAGGPQAQNAAARLLEMGGEARRLPDLKLVPLPDERRLVAQPERRLQPLVHRHPPFRVHAQNLARAQERGRDGVAGGRKGRHRRKQRVDLGQKPVAPAIERRRVERRIGVDALEAVLRQNLPERRRDRNAALGVEAMGEMGEETVHGAPRRAQSRRPGERPTAASAHDLLTGCRGIAWDPMGVNEATAIPAPGTALDALGVVKVKLPLGRRGLGIKDSASVAVSRPLSGESSKPFAAAD